MAFLYEVSSLVSIPMTQSGPFVFSSRNTNDCVAQSEAGDVSNETSPAAAEHVTH
jgi:hypothetical protein